MFLLLLKKQMTELFRGYFVDRKTGKIRSKWQIALFIMLFIFLLGMVSHAFSGVVEILGASLIPSGHDWLYFAVLGAASMVIGVFGSVFSAYSMLYLSKDNDLLLAMPIKPSVILSSRMASAYILSIIYEAVIYVPTVIVYRRYADNTAVDTLFQILNLFISCFAVLALTCFFGWLVAVAASRMRNKNTIVMILSLVIFGAYYVLMFRMNSMLNTLGDRALEWEDTFRKIYPLYAFGAGNTGNAVSFIAFAAISFALLAVAVLVMSATFLKLATSNKGAKKKKYKENSVKSAGMSSALLRREIARFAGTPIYMFNTGLGILIAPVVSVIALIKGDQLRAIVADGFPQYEFILPFAVITAVCLIFSMNNITAPSVSLEGKTLWIIRSVPVDTSKLLLSKIKLQMLLNSVPAAFSAAIMCFAFKTGIVSAVIAVSAVILSCLASASAGLMFNLLKPDFTWTNEIIPVKQDAPIIFSMLFGFASSLIPLPAGALLSGFGVPVALTAVCLIYLAAAVLMLRWIKTKGVTLFESF